MEDPSNPDFQHLLVDLLATRIMTTGVDGLFLDNLAIVEHTADATEAPCDSSCRQGGLDLVHKLRDRFPNALIVINNTVSDVTRLGSSEGVPFPSLIDGVHVEGVFYPQRLTGAESDLLAWKGMALERGGYPFWIGTTNYVGGCDQTAIAQQVYEESRADGFSPYAADGASGLNVVCYWPF
jgi:cysteinyl-tRNA synthetase